MKLVSSRPEIERNVDRLDTYILNQDRRREYVLGLISRGICFVVVKKDGRTFFAPSRFVGYRGNNPRKHQANLTKDGRITNKAITRVAGSRPRPSPLLEREYWAFCASINAEQRSAPFGAKRKFWDWR